MATLRTWQEAFSKDKVCCPHQDCTNKTAFFKKVGLEQHYRAEHGKIGEGTIKEAQDVFKNKHGEQVLKEMSRLYGVSSSEVFNYNLIY
jgi:hypothetical protein